MSEVMDHKALRQLAESRDGPAVSIFCSFDTHRPGNASDAGELSVLRDRAVEAVRAMLPGESSSALVERIDEAVGSVDLQHPMRGVAVLVSSTVSQVISLAAPVAPRVAVGERFALREVIAATGHSPHIRVVVLSRAKTRCIDLSGSDAVERRDFGFPVEVVAPTEADAPHGDFPLGEHEHAEAAKFVFRAVAHALRAVQRHDQRPVVLVGEERDLAYFGEVTDLAEHIVGRVHGNYERENAQAITRLVGPVLDEHERRLQQRACDEAREAIGSHAVCGLAGSWLAARCGRGHQLLVEDSYHVPVHVVDGMFGAAPAGEVGAFDFAEDAIEEIILHGGDVTVVPDGSLSDLGRIALLTRY